MYKIIQPSKIVFGLNAAKDYSYPQKTLVITSKGAIERRWFDYLNLQDFQVFDSVEPNPSMDVVDEILSSYDNTSFSSVIGLGGGSSLDVAKYVGFKTKKQKIMIPTTFGSGSEVTRISVLKINGKKKSFHDDNILSDVAIVDPYFINNTPLSVIKNSVIDACAQCTEAYDSKNSNRYTKFLCDQAFEILENGILNDQFGKFPLGSLISGLGFGNSSTTLGHALSYVYSNEGFVHGHALAHTTSIAHKFNKSKFSDRFKKIVKKLSIPPIKINGSLDDAAELILKDTKHLDNNPYPVFKKDIIKMLEEINAMA